MRSPTLVMLALLHGAVLPAAAAEFIPGWETSAVWDSNVLSAPNDPPPGQAGPESDFSLRAGPNLRLRQQTGDLTYDMTYRLRFEEFARINELNQLNSDANFDHTASLAGGWRITPTTRIDATNNFLFVTSYAGLFETQNATVTQPALGLVVPTRERITSNLATFGVVHSLSPIWQLSGQLNNQLFRFRDPAQSDSDATLGSLQLTRGFTRRLVAGFGSSINRQDFGDVEQVPGRGTTFYQIFGVVEYDISPTWSISVRAGPAITDPDQPDVSTDVQTASYLPVDPSTCPTVNGVPVFTPSSRDRFGGCAPSQFRFASTGQLVNPNLVTDVPQATENILVPFTGETGVNPSLTYFGRIAISKTFPQWYLSLSYDRSASSSSGLSTSTTLDSLSGTAIWTPKPLWEISLTADYATQTSASQIRTTVISLAPDAQFGTAGNPQQVVVAPTGVPIAVGTGDSIDNGIDITTYRIELRAQRQVSRNLTLIGDVSAFRQESSGDLQDPFQRDDFRVELGFIWNFDAIPL